MSGNRNVRVLWVDDDDGRRLKVRSIESKIGVIDPIHPVTLFEQTDGLNTLGKFILERKYDLVVLDYDLARNPLGGKTFSGRALRVLGAIRDQEAKFPALAKVPTCLISAHWGSEDRNWEYVGLSQFDALISERDLHHKNFARWLKDLGLQFRQLGLAIGNHHSVDLDLANKIALPPPDAVDDFMAAAAWQIDRFNDASFMPPAFLDDGQKYAGIALGRRIPVLEFVRWLRNRFMRLPGPLLDTKRAAVFLGMTPSAFGARLRQFSSAKYDGLFKSSTEGGALWWRCVLEQIVMRRADSETSAPTLAALSRITFKLTPREVAWCSVAYADKRRVEAEVLAYPSDVDIFLSESEGLLKPAARANCSADASADLPLPFDRVYRIPNR